MASTSIVDMNGQSDIWLCLHFEQLPLEAIIRNSSPENERPVVVLEKGRISLMNNAASSIGICPGSSMDTAIALSENIVSFERDETRELSVLSHLAQWAYQFTPNVSIKAPDSLLLDITGCLKLFHGLDNLKKTIEKNITGLGYTPVLGVNKTPLAALYTAHTRAPDNNGEVIPSLRALPIDCLQVEGKIIDSLKQTGIHNLGDLLKLPESGLARRYGVVFTEHLQRLVGKKKDPQKFVRPRPKFSSEITFLSDITNLNSLVFPIKRLLGELCDFLNARQLYAHQFTWGLFHRGRQAGAFNVYLANPENDISMFQTLTALHLEKLDDVKEVDSLRLSTSVFSPANTSSGDLFPRLRQRLHDSSDRRRDDKLLNMLRAKLGPQSCFGLSLANDHRPERAWRRVQPDQKACRLGDKQNPRPFYLLDPPGMLRVIECPGGELALLKGPERIDFGWWDPAGSQARDYYVARHNTGSLYWVYRHENRWYLHGIFS